MKKIVTAIVVLLNVMIVSGQQKQLSIAIKAGVILSNQTNHFQGKKITPSHLTGFTGGGSVNYRMSKWFGLQTDLTWSTVGTYARYDITRADQLIAFSSERNVHHYLFLPLKAKFYIARSGVSLLAGPQAGYLLSADIKRADPSRNFSLMFKRKKFELSLVGGIEFEVPHSSFFVSAGYQLGLTDIETDPYSSLKAYAGSFTIGYRIKRYLPKTGR